MLLKLPLDSLFTLQGLQTYIEDRHNIKFNQFSGTFHCFDRSAHIQHVWLALHIMLILCKKR